MEGYDDFYAWPSLVLKKLYMQYQTKGSRMAIEVSQIDKNGKWMNMT